MRIAASLHIRENVTAIVGEEHEAAREGSRDGLGSIVPACNRKPTFVRAVLHELDSMREIVACIVRSPSIRDQYRDG